MKKKICLISIIIIIAVLYLLIPYIMGLGKYEYLTTSKSPYTDSEKSYSKYALLITKDKYYIYNTLTKTFNYDYSSFIKNINKEYNQYPNVCENRELIDFEAGVECEISDEYLDLYLWYEDDLEYDWDRVKIDNKGNVYLEYEEDKYRFGEYIAYGIFYEMSFGNYEISQPNGNKYLIQGLDSEHIYDSFELVNINDQGKRYIENVVENFYIGKENAVFYVNNVIVNPLGNKIEIGDDFSKENRKLIAYDIYKDKYVLLGNGKFIEIRNIKNNILATYETDSDYHDLEMIEKDGSIYIIDRGTNRQEYVFNGNSIIKVLTNQTN